MTNLPFVRAGITCATNRLTCAKTRQTCARIDETFAPSGDTYAPIHETCAGFGLTGAEVWLPCARAGLTGAGRERRLAHARWGDFVFHEMDVNRLGRFGHADEAVFVEVRLFGSARLEGHFAVERIADAVRHGVLGHIGGSVGVHHDAAVCGGGDLLHHGLAVFHRQIEDVRCVAGVAEIGGNPTRNPSDHRRFAPARFVTNQFQHPGIAGSIVIILLADGIFLGPFQQFQPDSPDF